MSTHKRPTIEEQLEKIRGRPLTFGELVEAHRKTDEISQSALAKKIGVSRAHLCDIEKGRRYVSIERAAEIAEALGYSTAVFVKIAIEDQIRRAKLNFKVRIEAV